MVVFEKNSVIIHKQSTTDIIAVKESLYLITEHVDFNKSFDTIFSVCTTYILKILS